MSTLLHTGSVKDVHRGSKDGELVFHFSDRYSIFDWGTMPDEIPGKGNALAAMGRTFFYWLRKLGYTSHYLFPESEAPGCLSVKEVRVPRDEIEAAYQDRPVQTLVPLEILFRLGVPQGSSLLTRFPGKYSVGQKFDQPLIETSTKLERLDRNLSAEEAQALAGMNEAEWRKLMKHTTEIAKHLETFFFERGLMLWDGKFEFAFCEGSSGDSRDFMLVDSIGIDELRLTIDGYSVSKEVLRQQYVDSEWLKELRAAKTEFGAGFKSHCADVLKITPKPLSKEVLKLASQMYLLCAQLIEAEPKSAEAARLQLAEVLKRLNSCES